MLRTRQHMPHKKIKFTPEEDELLKSVILRFGTSNWVTIASLIPGRNVKQCKERWENHLVKTIEERNWEEDEDRLLVEKYKLFGKHWSKIMPFFRERTCPQIKRRIEFLIKKNNELNIVKTEIQNPVSPPINEPKISNDPIYITVPQDIEEEPVTVQEVKKPSPLFEILSSLGFELNSDQDEEWEKEFAATLDLSF